MEARNNLNSLIHSSLTTNLLVSHKQKLVGVVSDLLCCQLQSQIKPVRVKSAGVLHVPVWKSLITAQSERFID
jgi:hypothetical protein